MTSMLMPACSGDCCGEEGVAVALRGQNTEGCWLKGGMRPHAGLGMWAFHPPHSLHLLSYEMGAVREAVGGGMWREPSRR